MQRALGDSESRKALRNQQLARRVIKIVTRGLAKNTVTSPDEPEPMFALPLARALKALTGVTMKVGSPLIVPVLARAERP